MGTRINQRDLDILTKLPWPRVQVAAHELGHWLVWKQLPRARVVRVRIWGSDRAPQGHVDMDWSRTDETSDMGYLAGLLAGEEADKLWAAATGVPRMCGGASHDMAAFRTVRRKHEPSRQWSESQLRRQARSILTSHWDVLLRHVPYLAVNGRL